MIDKSFDTIVIGNNISSFLFSLELLEKNKKVLILNDRRVDYGSLDNCLTNQMELEFLKSWGKNKKISCIENIESYLKPIPLLFATKTFRIHFSKNPSLNLKELLRKLPIKFKDNYSNLNLLLNDSEYCLKFDNMLYKAYQNFGLILYKKNYFNEPNINDLIKIFPNKLIEIFNAFKNAILHFKDQDSRSFWQLHNFLYMCRGIYHKRLTSPYHFNDSELFYIFFSILSPYYYIDIPRLKTNLKRIYNKRGGNFQNTWVREWLFYKNSPWYLELAGYNGVVHSQKIAFMGNISDRMPIRLVNKKHFYKTLILNIKLKPEAKLLMENQLIIFSSIQSMGTSSPIWIGHYKKDFLQVSYFIRKKMGSKEAFIKEKIINKLLKDLPHCSLVTEDNISDIRCSFGKDYWTDTNQTLKEKFHPYSLIGNFNIGENFKIKNIYHLPIFENNNLGMISSLINIKYSQRLFN